MSVAAANAHCYGGAGHRRCECAPFRVAHLQQHHPLLCAMGSKCIGWRDVDTTRTDCICSHMLDAGSAPEKRATELDLTLGPTEEHGCFPSVPYRDRVTSTGFRWDSADLYGLEAAKTALESRLGIAVPQHFPAGERQHADDHAARDRAGAREWEVRCRASVGRHGHTWVSRHVQNVAPLGIASELGPGATRRECRATPINGVADGIPVYGTHNALISL